MTKSRPSCPAEGRLKPSSPARAFSLSTWACLLLILLVGAALRLAALDAVPPGLTHDEANNVADGAGILRGVCLLFFPVAQGKEPLYLYSVAGMMSLIGRTPFAMRLTTAFWGMLLLAVTFATTYRMFGRPAALLTTAGLALSFWGFSTSRMGLRAVTLPVFFTLTVYFLYRATLPRPARHSWRLAILGGLFLGITQYTYLAARVAPAVALLYALYLLLTRRRAGWTAIARIALAVALAAAVAAPLYLYLHFHPGLAVRIGMLDQPLRALAAGDPGPLWARVRPALGMFFLSGDTFAPYNIVGRPLFDPLTGVLFVLGLLVALWRWRRPAYGLALLWFAVGVFPAIVTGIEAVNLRAIMAQPVVYLFPALAVTTLARRGGAMEWRLYGWRRWVYGLAVLLLMAAGAEAAHAYFVTWANHRDTRAHYHVDLVAIADDLQAHPDADPAAVSGLYPGQFHDPRVVAAVPEYHDTATRWFDARGGLSLPAAAGRLYLPAVTPLDATLQAPFSAHATLLYTLTLRSEDFDPTVTVYRWDSPAALDDLLASMGRQPLYWSPADAFPPDNPLANAQPLTPPVAVGDRLTLLGYDLRTPAVAAGGSVEVVSLWRVSAAQPDEVVLFTHLLDPGGGFVIAQDDRLDVPSWGWQAGDAFLQVHRFNLPSTLAPGWYVLEMGAYLRRDPTARLPVTVAPGTTHHRVLLTPLEVVAP